MLGSTISALRGLGIRLKVSSDNVANFLSEGYKKKVVTLNEGPQGTVIADIEKGETLGYQMVDKGPSGGMIIRELSNVALEEEIPQTMITRRSYEANLKMVETKDEMLGDIIDIIK